jgi:cyclopropane-fatty-acyl-phospholipid synthase
MKIENLYKKLLNNAGIEINGKKPWDITVKNLRFYNRVIYKGTLGLGESYMDGWWDVDDLKEFFRRIIGSKIERKLYNWRVIIFLVWRYVVSKILDLGSRSSSSNIGKVHYDIGNDIYEAMLDKRMVYTSGYWKDAKNLDEAQEAKLDLICRKLRLKKGMRVLDIGCGWGSFLKFASERYGIEGVGVTVSKNQVELGRKICAGLPVDILFKDYRDVDGKFDAVVSIGMFEHVGPKYYEVFMKKVKTLLKEDGLFLLHTIGTHNVGSGSDPWIDKYIFPGAAIPFVSQISKSFQKSFVMEDWHNFGYDYSLTLVQWFKNFDNNWPSLKKTGKYDDRFYRMWKYYLLFFAGVFQERRLQLWQIVLSPKGVKGGYVSLR